MYPEHFDESVADYTSALGIRQDLYPSTDRVIANNCYKLAIAYEYSEKTLEAMKFYAMAAATLKSRLTSLKAAYEATTKPAEDSTKKAEGTKKEKIAETPEEIEMEDLEQLLPEIDGKVRFFVVAEGAKQPERFN